MIFCRQVPRPPLAQFVDWFWYYADWQPDHSREHVLPDGSFELIINLHDEPRRLFDCNNPYCFHSFRNAWISGTQSEYLVIDAVPDSSMIGIHFKPGGIAPFLGLPADELSNQVVELDRVWGVIAGEWRNRLLEADGPHARFGLLEQILLQLLRRNAAGTWGSERVAEAIKRLRRPGSVENIKGLAAELGWSHKHFIAQFRREVGLTPKLFARIRRFQEVLAQIGAKRTVEWADVAYSCGYYDQAHFVNDFQAFAGLNPTAYLSYRSDYPGFTRALERGK